MDFRTTFTAIALVVFSAFLMLKLSGIVGWPLWIITMPLWIAGMVVVAAIIGDWFMLWFKEFLR